MTRLVLARLRRDPATWLWIALWSAVEALPAAASGVVLAAALDRGFLAGDTPAGLALLAAVGGLHLVAAVATRALYPRLADVVEPLRDDLLRRVVAGTLRSAVAGRPPDLAAVARLTTQVETVRSLVSALLRTLRQGLVSAAAALAGLFWIDQAVALPVAGCLLAAAALYAAVVRRLVRRQHAALIAGEVLAERAGAVFGGLRDVVATGAERRASDDLGAAIEAHAAASEGVARSLAGRTLVIAVGGYLPLIVLLAVLPAQVRAGTLSIGEAVGAATYAGTRLLPAVTTVTSTVGTWLAQLSVVTRRLREAVGPLDGVAAGGHGIPDPTTGLRLRDVTFRYGPHADPIVAGLDLTVPPDGHLAVVGPSGIGKSTLTRIVTGELPPECGTVELGGVPVGRLDPEVLHRYVAVVPQEAYVFSGTLADNLRYLAPAASTDELDRAARATGLADLLPGLGGYDAVLGAGGGQLSSGVRQLIALTRAYLSPARVVILDEATCHLDLAQDAAIEAAFRRRPGMLIVIAHRLGSARRAPQVLLLDGPASVSSTHADLLVDSDRYAGLEAAGAETVVRTRATAGRGGTEPKPKVTGGSILAS